MIGGQATRRWISRARPRRGSRWTSARIVVERTMLSSTSRTRLPARTSGRGVYLRRALARAVGGPFDEGAADVAVAHQALDARAGQVRTPSRRPRPWPCRARGRRSCPRRRARLPAGPVPCRARRGSGRRSGRRACWRRWRSRSTRRSSARACGPAANRSIRTPSWLATARVPGSSERMSRKPRFASGTLSLAAANSGPCSAMQSGRKPERVAGHDQLAEGRQEHDVVRRRRTLGEVAEDLHPVGLGALGCELVAEIACIRISVSVSRLR